ncbi:mechanosensitive ion channel domain-containing protein [uncultured Ilyobacter sp.]|uniref:mechanosensitive ion channel family protein n=1 Tax=uncultured Ilyobacter sp. TaxID=544433 RepID=UPI0029F5502E|nr:mechanosensitive ion channel domain-containing protein [uncultured Ilyobacter sp.]
MTYYVALILVLIFTLIYLLIRLRTLENHFKGNVEDNKNFGSMRNGSAVLKKTLKRSKEKALKNIGARFTIIRRSLFIFWFLIMVFLLLYPFMGNFSKGVFSVFASTGTIFLGFAAKPFIENIIAGMVITLSKQFNVGDTILIKDQYGVVEDINMTHTIVKLWDWQRFVIPNVNMLKENFINYTLVDESQWAKVEFWISYEADMGVVKELALKIAKENTHINLRSEPHFWLMDMTSENIKCWVTALTDTPANGWSFKNEFRLKFYTELRKLGIKPHFKYVLINEKFEKQG